MFVDHIAVLTADLQRQSEALPGFCQKRAIESFPSEGTQEQYVELAKGSPKLLLLQAIADGPYARALEKRGPGLHHIGVKTPSIEAMIATLSEQGLLLHPITIRTLAQGVAWLCRPGLPFLIELTQGSAPAGDFDLIALELPVKVPVSAENLFANLRIRQASIHRLGLKVGNRLISLEPL